jgi:hypothetical protein
MKPPMHKAGKNMNPSDLRLIRYAVATIWLVTGVVVLTIYPKQDSLDMLARVGLSGMPAMVALYGGAGLDLLLGVMTLTVRGKSLWKIQAGLIVVYSMIITIYLPEFWMHPFGPILKNLPILVLLSLLHNNENELS